MQNFQDVFIFSRERIISGEIWRIWSGQLVHSNYSHLLMNASGFVILLIIYKNTFSNIQLLIRIAYLSSCIGLGLYIFNPEIQLYAGLSGIIYGLFTIAAIQAYFQNKHLLAYPIFIAISGKIFWENVDGSINNTSSSIINAHVASDAHLYGYISALILELFIAIHKKGAN